VKPSALLLLLSALLAGASPSSYREIAAAERTRSLEGGKLAAYLDQDAPLATRAALAIGRTKDPAGIAPLRAHLGIADPTARAMVVYALGLLVDRGSLATIQTLTRTDSNSAVRYAAVDAVGRIASADARATAFAANDLLAALRRDADPIVRAHAAANLDAFRTTPGARQVAIALQRAFKADRDGDVRWHIMWTLSRGYAPLTSRGFFKAALADGSDVVRLEAARGIGRRADPTAVPLLMPLLADPSWRVQEEAFEAIRRLKKMALTEHLAALQEGLHLPPVATVAAESASPLPRPTSTAKPVVPATDDARLTPPLLPSTAALMNGPMPGPHPRVRVTTTKGTFVLRLYPEWAPYTVANFLNLANAGFFDGNRWFRIVPDFVVQTGDPKNTGDGDAGYSIGAEENPVEQRTGVISMGLNYDEKTNKPIRDSAGSQFYITLSPQLHLDRDFTVFGEVESGFGVLPRLVEADKMVRVEQIADA
jgi:peptidyl-prolyl cis-trans isomerase B (cyclophilin B)